MEKSRRQSAIIKKLTHMQISLTLRALGRREKKRRLWQKGNLMRFVWIEHTTFRLMELEV